eukprot:gene629-620_t
MKRLFVLGDSITVGYGPFLKEFVNTSTSGVWSYGRKNEGGDGSDMSIYGLNGGNSKDVLRYLTLLASEAPIADSGSSGANAKPDPRSGTVRVLTTGDGGVPMLQPTTTTTFQAPPSKVAGRTVDILLLNCGLHDIKCMSSSDTIAMGAAAAEDTAAAAAAAVAIRAGGRKHDGVTPNISLAEYCSNLRAAINTARESLITPAAVGVVWVKTSPVIDAIHNSKGMPWNRHAAKVGEYNAAADAICAELSVPTIDLHGFLSAKGPSVFRDHVHYTEDVEKETAAFVFEQLKPYMGVADDGGE